VNGHSTGLIAPARCPGSILFELLAIRLLKYACWRSKFYQRFNDDEQAAAYLMDWLMERYLAKKKK
jgi:hypothetical protein